MTSGLLCIGAFLLARYYWHPAPDPLQARFIKAKHAEARRLAVSDTNLIPSEVWDFFRAAERNDLGAATNIYNKLAESEYAPRPGRSAVEKLWDDFKQALGVRGKERPFWHQSEGYVTPMWESIEALQLFRTSDPKWIRRLGTELVATVSTNGILLSGTDSGRVTVLCVNGPSPERKPIYTVALTALADGGYMEYLRQTLGGSMVAPTTNEAQYAFQEYMSEAQQRMDAGQSANTTNAPPFQSGRRAVMEINAKLARRLFEKNPGREFFVDDAFAADWMLPLLEPDGPILRLRATPPKALSDEVVRKDRDYWQRLVGELVGPWLGAETTVAEVARFCETIYIRNDMSGFNGDTTFVADGRIRAAFARLRASIGRVYMWQAEHAASPLEQKRMKAEADFAFRQAIALCPSLTEASETYADFLREIGQGDSSQTVLRLQTATSSGR